MAYWVRSLVPSEAKATSLSTVAAVSAAEGTSTITPGVFSPAAAQSEAKAKLATRLRLWTQKLIEAYWESYRAALTDERLWPRDDEQSRQLLDFFLLEKAFYEIEYELTNRPDWVGIPLEATLRILRQRGVVPS